MLPGPAGQWAQASCCREPWAQPTTSPVTQGQSLSLHEAPVGACLTDGDTEAHGLSQASPVKRPDPGHFLTREESPAPWPRETSGLSGRDPGIWPCPCCGPAFSPGSPSGGGAEGHPGHQHSPSEGPDPQRERPAPCAKCPGAHLDGTPRGPLRALKGLVGWGDVHTIIRHMDLFL